MHEYETKPIKKKSIVRNESEAFENNCADLLVKALYNDSKGVLIPSSYRNRDKYHVSISGSDSTPDFLAVVKNSLSPIFASCLASTLSGVSPTLEIPELSSPPPSPPSSTVSSKESTDPEMIHVIFEFTLDQKLWKSKMEQLEGYVRIILDSNASAHCLAGVGFPTTRRFKSIKGTLEKSKGKEYPNLWRLHTAGKLLYLVCDRNFVTATYSDISSQSGSIDKLQNLILGFMRAMVDPEEDK